MQDLNEILGIKPKDEPAYWFLVCAQIMFRVSEEADIGAVLQNTVIKTTDGRIRVADLAKAQQGVQASFFNKMGDTQCQVVDVVITALEPLGFMDTADFNKGAPPIVPPAAPKAAN